MVNTQSTAATAGDVLLPVTQKGGDLAARQRVTGVCGSIGADEG